MVGPGSPRVGTLLLETFWDQARFKAMFRRMVRSAVSIDCAHRLRLLVEIGCDLCQGTGVPYTRTILAFACLYGNTKCVKCILGLEGRDDILFAKRSGGGLTATYHTALRIAVSYRHPEIVKLLLNDVRVQELPSTPASFYTIFRRMACYFEGFSSHNNLSYAERSVVKKSNYISTYLMKDHPFLERVPLADLRAIKNFIITKWIWAMNHPDRSIPLGMLPFIRVVALRVKWVGQKAFDTAETKLGDSMQGSDLRNRACYGLEESSGALK
jgi:hypothetical protein